MKSIDLSPRKSQSRTLITYLFGALLIISLLSGSSAMALTDYVFFTINGDTSLTSMTQGDEFAWGANCDTGSTIVWEIWVDLNSNSIPEPGSDLLLNRFMATDGDISPDSDNQDISGTPDGYYQSGPMLLGIAVGQYIFTALDLADSTSAQRVVINTAMASPPNRFRGHLSVPGHPAPNSILENIWIETEHDEEDGETDPGFYAGLTDENGYFVINIGDVGTGFSFKIQPNRIPGYIRPQWRDVVASGLVENVDFYYTAPADSIYGYVLDDLGAPIPDDIRIEAHPNFSGPQKKVTSSDPASGRYVLYFEDSDIGQWVTGTWDRDLLPDHILPRRTWFNYRGDSSYENDIICHQTDSYIYIRITENDSLPDRKYLIFGSSEILESETQGISGIGADNLLALPISSQDNSGWQVYFAFWDGEYTIPEGFTIETSNTWGLGPGDTATFNFVGPVLKGTITQDPEDAPIDWNLVQVDLFDEVTYTTSVDDGGSYTAYPGSGSFVVTPRAEGYLFSPHLGWVEIEGGVEANLDFEVNKAHCRVSGRVSGLQELSDVWIIAHAGSDPDSYRTRALVDSITGEYELWLCDGDWSVRPPIVDGYYIHGAVSMVIDESDTPYTLDFGYAAESCCGLYTSGYTGNTDCSSDGKRNIADITRLIDRIYGSKILLCCEENGNTVTDVGFKLNIADITKLIDLIYVSKTEPASCEQSSAWQTIFEDNFDGAELDGDNWTQFQEVPAPYSLTGSGELEVQGESGDDVEGVTFVYNTPVAGDYVRVVTKFRTNISDPIADDVEVGIFLNIDDSETKLYVLYLMSDPFMATRDYELLIYDLTDDSATLLARESIGSLMPQLVGERDYTLEGTNANGTITLTVKDENGAKIKSLSVGDTSHSGGRVAISADLNIDSGVPASIFFDYVKVQVYQWSSRPPD